MNAAFLRFLTAALILFSAQANASFLIGAKGHVNGPAIHSTYFYTPNNAPFTVTAAAYVGNRINGMCQYVASYNIGSEVLQTGDVVAIDANQLKALAGGGYNCMSIFYNYRQVVRNSFTLFFDGINYNTSAPATDQVTIL